MVIFDFDGVMMNSLQEVALTSINATSDNFYTDLDSIPKGYLKLFFTNRFHVQPAADFIPFAKWCLDNSAQSSDTPISRDKYIALLESTSISKEKRTELFFNARAHFIETQKKTWLKLHSVYQPLWDELQKNASRVVLLTNKNKAAVTELSNHFGLALSVNNIYSGDNSCSKIENFKKIDRRFKSKFYFFIDDSVKNLIELKKANLELNIKFALAEWGYLGHKDVKTAMANSFSPLSQTGLIKIMRDNSLRH